MSDGGETVLTDWIDRLLQAGSQGDLETLLSFYHPQAYYQDPSVPQGLQGHDSLQRYLQKSLNTHPRWLWTRHDLFASEQGLSLRWQLRWAEPWRPVIKGLAWIEHQDQLITRHEVYFDTRHWPEKPGLWCNGDLEVSTEKQRLPREALLQLLRSTYWAADLSREHLAYRIEHSSCFGLYHQQRLIGFARALTDLRLAYVADVVIEPEFQGQGLGNWLMSCLLETPHLKETKRWLLRTRDAQEFYQQLGFENLGSDDIFSWMEKTNF